MSVGYVDAVGHRPFLCLIASKDRSKLLSEEKKLEIFSIYNTN